MEIVGIDILSFLLKYNIFVVLKSPSISLKNLCIQIGA